MGDNILLNSTILIALKSLHKFLPVSETLIDQLYTLDRSLIYFFLPQFLILLVKTKNSQLEKFLLYCCNHEIHFALKTICYLNAIIPSTNQTRTINFLEKLAEKCKSAFNLNKFSNVSEVSRYSHFAEISLDNQSMLSSMNKASMASLTIHKQTQPDPLIHGNSLTKSPHKESLVMKHDSSLAEHLNFLHKLELIAIHLSRINKCERISRLKFFLENVNSRLDSTVSIPSAFTLDFQNKKISTIDTKNSILLSSKKKCPYLFRVSLEQTKISPKKDSHAIHAIFAKTFEISDNSAAFICKSDSGLRQEHLASQIIFLFNQIWTNAKLPLKLTVYSVLVTSATGGILEVIPNAVSIDHIRKHFENFTTLNDFYLRVWGALGSHQLEKAKKNFVESMAAYSLLTYFLQIKDRHNGNILIDSTGAVAHIDFEYFLSNSPGRNANFESVPFKLLSEHVETMLFQNSPRNFELFKLLMIHGFLEVRKHWSSLSMILEIMSECDFVEKLPCFSKGASAVKEFRDRFCIEKSDSECMAHVCELVEESLDNWRTLQYDSYQRITNGIM